MKVYNRSNSIHQMHKGSGIRMYPKTGQIMLSKSLVSILGISTSDGLEFGFEEGEWYLRKSRVDGLVLRSRRSTGNGLVTSSTCLVRDILKFYAPLQYYKEVRCIRIPVAHQPTEIDGVGWYALLFGASQLTMNSD